MTKTQPPEIPTEDNQSISHESSNPNQGKFRIISILLAIGVLSGGGWYWWNSSKVEQSSAASSQIPATGVKLITLGKETIEESTDYLGNLEASQTVNLNSEVEGRIVEILVREGQAINRGNFLFRLQSDTLQAQLNQAQATLKSRQARLDELENGSRQEDIAMAQAKLRQAQIRLNNSRQGSSQAEIAQAKAQLESAEAEAKLASQKVDRYNLLKEEGAISQDQFDNFLTSARTTSAQVNVAQKRLEELQKGTNSNIDELNAAVEEARQNLQLLENGARKEEIAQAKANVQEAKANVQRIETILDKTFVKAPIGGKIGNIPVKVGDYIDTDDTLTTITENSELELNIAVPLEQASQLQMGLPVQILNQNQQPIATGKINFIESNVTADSQLVGVQAIFNNINLDRNLLNRQFVQSRIIWDTNQGVLIPSSSIFRIGGQAFVFTAETNPEGEGLIARQQGITLGDIQGNNYKVLEGLNAGDKILTAGILQVRDGAPIQEIPETDTNSTSLNN